MKGWAIVKVGPEQLPKINRYLKNPGVVSWLDDTGRGLWMASGVNLTAKVMKSTCSPVPDNAWVECWSPR